MEFEEHIVIRDPDSHQILRPYFTGVKPEPKEEEPKDKPLEDLSMTE